MSGIITLSLITAEIEDQFLITSSLVKVLPVVRLVGPLVGGLEPWLELTDQGIVLQTHIDGSRILEPSSRQPVFLRVVAGVYPIFTWSNCVRCRGISSNGLPPPVISLLVETRRLELLAFSLQRRCSSN